MRPPTGHGSLWLFMLALGGLMILGASNEAGAGGESEPNDNAASADQTTISGYANGTVWGGNPDVWKVDLPGPGLFSTEIERSQRGAYLRFADSGLMGVPTGIEEVTANRDLYSAVISSGGVIYVSVGCDICFGIDYRLTFSFTADLSSISGAGEHESNNAVSFANQVSLNATAEGLVAEKFADVDWWAVQTFSPGLLRLDVDNRENVSVALFAGNVQLSDEMGYGTRFSLYRTPSAERFNLSVVSNGGTNPYSVRFTFGIESAVFWQGTDEIEPNGNASIAMTLAMGVSFKGVGDSSHDASDMFRYHGKRGELVGFNVTFEDDAFGESNVKTVGGVAEWIPVPTVRGSLLTVAYLFATDSYFVFDVRVGTSNGSYRVALRGQMLPLFSDGIVSLEELNAIPALGLTIHPKNVPNFDPTPHYWEDPVGYNLGNGDGFLFGETLCFRLTVAGDLPEVWVTAGTSFKPTKPELQVLIASRTAATRIPSGDRGCFRAMSHTENGALGVPWDLYAIDGFAVGDAARVIKRINETNLDGAEGQLALWAVTSGTSEERAKQWSASPSTIVSAKTILDGASVKTKLNAPPPNYEILMGAILVGAIVLGAVAVRRRKSNSETFSPPSLASVNSGAAPLVLPPPVPQWPAAPLSAMAPCPQCQQPVGVGNPQCNRCGLPLVWF